MQYSQETHFLQTPGKRIAINHCCQLLLTVYPTQLSHFPQGAWAARFRHTNATVFDNQKPTSDIKMEAQECRRESTWLRHVTSQTEKTIIFSSLTLRSWEAGTPFTAHPLDLFPHSARYALWEGSSIAW